MDLLDFVADKRIEYFKRGDFAGIASRKRGEKINFFEWKRRSTLKPFAGMSFLDKDPGSFGVNRFHDTAIFVAGVKEL